MAKSTAETKEQKELPSFFASKKKKRVQPRITVKVSGVKGELRNNIYNHLAIYRLRNSPKLQQVSVQQLFRQAKDDITKALAPFGYYNPQVEARLREKPRAAGISPADPRPFWEASFVVDRGKPVIVTSAEISILGAGQHNRMLERQVASFAVGAGAVLNQKLYEEDKKSLLKVALAQGYLDAGFIRSEVRIDPVANKGRIWLTLDTGRCFYFGETLLVSASSRSLDPSLLQGYLPWKKGDPYDLAKIFALQALLHNVGFFTEVNVLGRPQQAENGFIPVEVKAKFAEKNTTYTIGLGYATDVGVRTKLKWQNRLLSSRGDKMGGLLAIAEREKNISLSYKLPYEKYPRYDHYFLIASYQEKSWGETKSYPLSVAVGRDYSSPAYNLGASLEFLDEDYTVGEIEEHARFLLPAANIGFAIADDIMAITNGVRVGATIKGAREEFFADADLFQWKASGKVVFSPLPQWFVRGRIVGGMTIGDGVNSLPPSLRFYAGGDNSIRGYAYKSIGPANSEGKVTGGRYLFTDSVEIERLFGSYFGLAIFWDSGTVTNDVEPNFYHGAGAGLRVHMPFGEIKLDCASALSKPGDPLRIHFSVEGTL